MVKKKAVPEEVDSDLADLLGNDENMAMKSGNGARTQQMDLDHVVQKTVDVSSNRKSRQPYSNLNSRMSVFEFISGYISLLCWYYPRLCTFFMILTISVAMLMLLNLIINPVEEYGVIRHDHSNIRSKYDLTMGSVDHWCLHGGDSSCACDDPLTPLSRADHLSWVETFKANRRKIKKYEDDLESAELDVVFLGESVVEAMGGRWMGKTRSDDLKGLATMFHKRFSKKSGATIEGLPLGIAGDTAPNVLWRLLHGEMPNYLRPKIWWLSLGMNDLARMECSEEIVILGILRIVEEIMENRPEARIVINSLFPVAHRRGGVYPVLSEYNDAFAKPVRASVQVAPVVENNVGTRRDKQRSLVSALAKEKTDQQRSEAAENEEEKRDRKYRRHHPMEDKGSAVLVEKKKVKRYRPITGFTKKTPVPYWTSVRAINAELRKFAEKHEHVYYFDATDLFIDKENPKRAKLLTDRITVKAHLTKKGFEVWEDAIVKKVTAILAKMRQEQPDLFTSATNPDEVQQWAVNSTAVDDDEAGFGGEVYASMDDGFVPVTSKSGSFIHPPAGGDRDVDSEIEDQRSSEEGSGDGEQSKGGSEGSKKSEDRESGENNRESKGEPESSEKSKDKESDGKDGEQAQDAENGEKANEPRDTTDAGDGSETKPDDEGDNGKQPKGKKDDARASGTSSDEEKPTKRKKDDGKSKKKKDGEGGNKSKDKKQQDDEDAKDVKDDTKTSADDKSKEPDTSDENADKPGSTATDEKKDGDAADSQEQGSGDNRGSKESSRNVDESGAGQKGDSADRKGGDETENKSGSDGSDDDD